ncbi:MAG TPA: GxxExxY protein [Usitatibacter sp.]|nr:GxxExxY protein [Usitatibacter sp.]
MEELVAGGLTSKVLKCAFKVHAALGPGLLESAYRACLAYELRQAGLQTEAEVPIPVRYRGLDLECGYRADLIVENQVLIELKSVERLLPIHSAQILTYLKLSRRSVGFLMNFNSTSLGQAYRRYVLSPEKHSA